MTIATMTNSETVEWKQNWFNRLVRLELSLAA